MQEEYAGSLFEQIMPGEEFTIRVESWARDVELTTLSKPTTDHVGIFADEVVERIGAEPWMFSAATDGADSDFVFFLGGDGEIRVAFGETAAEAGVCQRIDPDAFFIE